jgi:uroporphyrinogen decarboxylase
MLCSQPEIVRELLEHVARATAQYLKSQIAAGAAAVQLFDTWAGELSRADYDAFELPATKMVYELLGHSNVPKILYAKGPGHLLESLARSGADVVSVDWHSDLAEARRTLGRSVALQGNVDPTILLGPEAAVRRAAQAAVEKTGGLGHILNLGHGILPTTPVANAKAFVDAGKTARVPAPARVEIA